MSDPLLEMFGSENMEALGRDGRAGLSSITSDFANWMQNKSRLRAEVEGELEATAGVRGHSTGKSEEVGRSGGG